jgi:hypothetical protein
VLPDLTMLSFVNFVGIGDQDESSLADRPDIQLQHFGGTMAPISTLSLDGDTAYLQEAFQQHFGSVYIPLIER